MVASLNHPNILAVYDIGVHDDAPYIASELLDGGTLREAFPSGALVLRRALDYSAAWQGNPLELFSTRSGSAEARALGSVGASRWSSDGRFLYVFRRDELPTRVYRVEVATGRKTLWKEIGPPDPAGVTGVGHLMFTPDGLFYVYNYVRTLSDLYLVEGVK